MPTTDVVSTGGFERAIRRGGPTEVHKVTLARQLLKVYAPAPDLFPSEHLPRLRAEAEAKFADGLAGISRP